MRREGRASHGGRESDEGSDGRSAQPQHLSRPTEGREGRSPREGTALRNDERGTEATVRSVSKERGPGSGRILSRPKGREESGVERNGRGMRHGPDEERSEPARSHHFSFHTPRRGLSEAKGGAKRSGATNRTA